MDEQSVHGKIMMERGPVDGTLLSGQPGDAVCDYEVMWAPFGRWVASCEGGYYVPFWASATDITTIHDN